MICWYILIFTVPPQAISINDLPAGNNIEVRQGDKVVLYCKAVGSKPPTQLVWYKNDNELFDGELFTTTSFEYVNEIIHTSLVDEETLFVFSNTLKDTYI